MPSRIQIAWFLLTKTTFRHWRKRAGHYLLLIGIVAVGVGAFNGIRQASRAASANFGLFNQAISGQSDFLIESPSQRLQEEDLADMERSLDSLTGILFRSLRARLLQFDKRLKARSSYD